MEHAAVDVPVDVLVASETTAAALRQSRSCRAVRARIYVNVPDPADCSIEQTSLSPAPVRIRGRTVHVRITLLLVETYPHQWVLGDSLIANGRSVRDSRRWVN